MAQEFLFTGASLDDFTEAVAQKLAEKLSAAQSRDQLPPSSQEDILFKSLQEAADYYGVCYQTISKNLDSIPHLTFGRAIRLYKSHIDAAITKDNIFSRKRGGRK